MKRKRYRLHFDRLRKKFQLSVFNESTLENVFSLRVSLLDGLFLVASVFIVFFFFSLVALVYSPLRFLLPEDFDPKLRKQLVNEAFRVDSLSDVVDKQTAYIEAVKNIVSGNIQEDTLKKYGKKRMLDTLAHRRFEPMRATEKEKAFCSQYEESEKYNLSILDEQPSEGELLFYCPIKGKMVDAFNPKLKHFGIRIQVDDQQPTLAVLDGSVVFAGYTSDYGYVVQVQHNNSYISVYKNNSELLKKQGDKVKAGEAIGIIGKNPTSGCLSCLYFELWHKGVALNPQDYIVF